MNLRNPWRKFLTIVVCFDAPVSKTLSAVPEEKLINNKYQIFSRIFSKDIWGSAGFFIEVVETKIDHHKILDNFWLGIFVLKILWVFILIIKLHACCLKVKINYKKLYAKLQVVNLPLFEKFRSLVNFSHHPSSSFPG